MSEYSPDRRSEIEIFESRRAELVSRAEDAMEAGDSISATLCSQLAEQYRQYITGERPLPTPDISYPEDPIF